MSEQHSAENDAPHIEVQWAVDMGFAVIRARDEGHARQWVKGYEDNPDAVTEGDPMPVVVRRTVTTTPWGQAMTVENGATRLAREAGLPYCPACGDSAHTPGKCKCQNLALGRCICPEPGFERGLPPSVIPPGSTP